MTCLLEKVIDYVNLSCSYFPLHSMAYQVSYCGHTVNLNVLSLGVIFTLLFPYPTGFEFDYIFDWTILKYQQTQKTKTPAQSSVSFFTMCFSSVIFLQLLSRLVCISLHYLSKFSETLFLQFFKVLPIKVILTYR